MAKGKKKSVAPATMADVDAVFAGWAADQQAKGVGPAVLTGGESMARFVGIYLPHLALRFFFQSTVLPLGRMMQIAGPQMSGKSTFLYYLYRLFRLNSGTNFHIENETKDSEQRRLAILDYDEAACVTIISEALEDWQEEIVWLLQEEGTPERGPSLKQRLTAAGLKGATPMCIGVDSLTAKSNRAHIAKVMSEGSAGQDRSQQDNAQSISKWLKVVPQQFGEWPFFLACTNHLKPGTEVLYPGGPPVPVDNVGGGMSMKFQETYQVHMKRTGGNIRAHGEEGTRYRMNMVKNSAGEDGRTIEVDVVSRMERDESSRNYKKQLTRFKWHDATVELILGKNSHEFAKCASIPKELQQVTGIKSATAGHCYSALLGGTADDPITYAEMGALLEEGPQDMLDELNMILCIHPHRIFEPGVRFQSQLAQAQAEAALPDEVKE